MSGCRVGARMIKCSVVMMKRVMVLLVRAGWSVVLRVVVTR